MFLQFKKLFMIVQCQVPAFWGNTVSSSEFVLEGWEWGEALWGLRSQAFLWLQFHVEHSVCAKG